MRISDWSSDVCSSDLLAVFVCASLSADGIAVSTDRLRHQRRTVESPRRTTTQARQDLIRTAGLARNLPQASVTIRTTAEALLVIGAEAAVIPGARAGLRTARAEHTGRAAGRARGGQDGEIRVGA